MVIGQHNVESADYSPYSWVGTDPLFVIGNGKGATAGVPNRSNAMVVLKNGNVGVGINAPEYKMDVIGDSRFVAGNLMLLSGGAGIPTGFSIGRTGVEADLGIAAGPGQGATFTNEGDAILRTSVPAKRLFLSNGSGDPTMVLTYKKVGIGTAVPEEALHVVGKIKVDGDILYGGAIIDQIPDFVFLPGYTKYFKTSEVDQFIKDNGHLPWFTSAGDQKEEVSLTRLQLETVETVENLQLQLIELQKEHQEMISKQQTEIDILKTELEQIKALLKK